MLTRAELRTLPSYVPGRTVPGAIKLASNEVPYGLLPGVAEAIARAAAEANRYPDLASVVLRESLAHRLGFDPERIATGCGSVALTEHIALATCNDGDEIVYSWRSFEAYPIIAAGTGAVGVRVPNNAMHGHDLKAMAAAVTGKTRLVLVCNPNNPTSTAVRRDELDEFLDTVPPDVLVVLDEAYHEFVTDPQVPDCMKTYTHLPNVVVLRTLSKAWGLAGLRVGYLVAQPEVAAAVRKVTTPFSTSNVAQAAALAALDAQVEMRRRVALVVAERERVLATLSRDLPEIPASQANFVWLPLREDSMPYAQHCERAGVIVRPFPGEGVRVTIGTAVENDALLAASASFFAERDGLRRAGSAAASAARTAPKASLKAAPKTAPKKATAKATDPAAGQRAATAVGRQRTSPTRRATSSAGRARPARPA